MLLSRLVPWYLLNPGVLRIGKEVDARLRHRTYFIAPVFRSLSCKDEKPLARSDFAKVLLYQVDYNNPIIMSVHRDQTYAERGVYLSATLVLNLRYFGYVRFEDRCLVCRPSDTFYIANFPPP